MRKPTLKECTRKGNAHHFELWSNSGVIRGAEQKEKGFRGFQGREGNSLVEIRGAVYEGWKRKLLHSKKIEKTTNQLTEGGEGNRNESRRSNAARKGVGICQSELPLPRTCKDRFEQKGQGH